MEAPEAREPGTNEAPSEELDASQTHTLTFDTSCGSFTVTLDPEPAPKTAASLVALAESGYFDDTIFHRVVPGFVIQGGDPTQTGGGGPGLLDRRRARLGRDVHEGRRRDGEVRRRGARHRREASSSSSPARTPACHPTTRSSAR